MIIFWIRVATLTDVGTFLDQGYYPNQGMLFLIRVATLIDFSRRKKNMHFYSCFCGVAVISFGGESQGGYPNQIAFLKKKAQGGHPNAKFRKTSCEMQSIAPTRNVACIRVGTLIYFD